MSAEKVAACLADYMIAVRREERARVEYRGYSWGYAGSAVITARQDASEAFGNALNEHIDERIEAATGTRP